MPGPTSLSPGAPGAPTACTGEWFTQQYWWGTPGLAGAGGSATDGPRSSGGGGGGELAPRWGAAGAPGYRCNPPPSPKSEEVGIGSLGRVSPGRLWLCSCFLLHPQCRAEGLGLNPDRKYGSFCQAEPRAPEGVVEHEGCPSRGHSQSGVPHKQLCPFICPSVCSECSGVRPSATGVIWSVCDACLGFPRVGWRSREIIFSAWRLWNRHLGIPTCGGQRGRAGVSIRQTRETRS